MGKKIAVLVMAVAIAQGMSFGLETAQADQTLFTAAAYPTTITGHQEPAGLNLEANYFEATPGRKVACAQATYEATLTAASTALTVTPHFTECQNEGGIGVTVKLDGCHYELEAGDATSAEYAHGSLAVICPAEKTITVIIGSGICVVDIPAQTVTGGVAFRNKGGSTVTAEVDVTEQLRYTDTDNSFFCPFSGTGAFENGSFRSDVLFHCYKDLGSHTGETEAGVTKTTYTHGEANSCDVA